MARKAKNVTSSSTDSTDSTSTATPTATENKEKRVPMARVFDANGNILKIGKAISSVSAFIAAFLKLPRKEKAGYDNYWSGKDGFTNNTAIRKLSPQGVGKMLAVLHHQAASIIAHGGDEAQEMQEILESISGYQSIAVAEAVKARETRLVDDAVISFAKAKGCSIEEAKQLVANMALATTAPAATSDELETVEA